MANQPRWDAVWVWKAKRSEGRHRINSLNVAPIRQILERWINKYEAYGTNTLLRVKESAEGENVENEGSQTKRA